MTKRKKSSSSSRTPTLLGVLGLVVIAIIYYVIQSNPDLQIAGQPVGEILNTVIAPTQESSGSATTGGTTTGGDQGGTTGQADTSGQPAPAGMPDASFKQTPQEITFHDCPPEGDGGDPELNKLKNRVDDGNWQPVAFDTILNLPWPTEIERRDRANWSAADLAAIEQYEGFPVQVDGYLALSRQSGDKSTNCHLADDHDFHIWLIDHPGDETDRPGSVVIETTPRVMANHPLWTVGNLNQPGP